MSSPDAIRGRARALQDYAAGFEDAHPEAARRMRIAADDLLELADRCEGYASAVVSLKAREAEWRRQRGFSD